VLRAKSARAPPSKLKVGDRETIKVKTESKRRGFLDGANGMDKT
jgi:hypothetical protein